MTVSTRAAELAVEQLYAASYARLLRRWDTVVHYDDPEAWVRAVAFRLLSNRARKVRNGIRAVGRLPESATPPAPDSDRVDLTQALARLTLTQRQVVVLHYPAGFFYSAAATSPSYNSGTATCVRADKVYVPGAGLQDLTVDCHLK